MTRKVDKVEDGSKQREHGTTESGKLLGWTGLEVGFKTNREERSKHAEGRQEGSNRQTDTEIDQQKDGEIASPNLEMKGATEDRQTEDEKTRSADHVVVDSVGKPKERHHGLTALDGYESGGFESFRVLGDLTSHQAAQFLLEFTLSVKFLGVIASTDKVAPQENKGYRLLSVLVTGELENFVSFRHFVDFDADDRDTHLLGEKILDVATKGAPRATDDKHSMFFYQIIDLVANLRSNSVRFWAQRIDFSPASFSRILPSRRPSHRATPASPGSGSR